MEAAIQFEEITSLDSGRFKEWLRRILPMLDACGSSGGKITSSVPSSDSSCITVVPEKRDETFRPSRAFMAFGTKVIVDGRKIAEVKTVRLVESGIECECNFIPQDEGQQHAIHTLQDSSQYGHITIELPNGINLTAYGKVTGKVDIPHNQVPRFIFTVNGAIEFKPQNS